MEKLRKVEVSEHFSSSKVKKGFFHRWFVKGYEDGETFLCAVIELEDGRIEVLKTNENNIRFITEQEEMQQGLDKMYGEK